MSDKVHFCHLNHSIEHALTNGQVETAAFYQPKCALPVRGIHEPPEVLAPAGNFEKMKAAILYGADAVYMAGHRFGLRAFADNFSLADIERAVDYAHRHGVRVYITLNSLLRSHELDDVTAFARELNEIGVDAVIVSDPGVFRVVRRSVPTLDVHISTQASTSNAEACLLWHDLGAKRIVLARELSMEDITEIRLQLPEDLSLEAFVHGAMCMAWSGRCLLSKSATGRDANRGACVQPCRWSYKVTEVGRMTEDDEGDPYTWQIETDEHGSYMFSSKDLCMVNHLKELYEAGVDSFKIEGRMKGAYYVAVVTKMYRQAVDDLMAGIEDKNRQHMRMQELMSMVHRTYDTGFYFANPLVDAKVATDQTYNNEATVVAVVLEQVGRHLICEQRNKLQVGDVIDVFSPHEDTATFEVQHLWNEAGEVVEACPHPKQRFEIECPEGWTVEAGSYLRRMGVKHGETA